MTGLQGAMPNGTWLIAVLVAAALALWFVSSLFDKRDPYYDHRGISLPRTVDATRAYEKSWSRPHVPTA